MNKLNIPFNGVNQKIEYTTKFATGIFIVTDNKLVKNNCKVLRISVIRNKPFGELAKFP